MRHLAAFFATACIVFMIFWPTAASSQKTIVWKGGTPGQETNWDCPKNWSSHRLPDEFSNVIIPQVSSTTRANPVIRSGTVEVNALFMDSNARLSIAAGACLVVYDYAEGINASNLDQQGAMIVMGEAGQVPAMADSACAQVPRKKGQPRH